MLYFHATFECSERKIVETATASTDLSWYLSSVSSGGRLALSSRRAVAYSKGKVLSFFFYATTAPANYVNHTTESGDSQVTGDHA